LHLPRGECPQSQASWEKPSVGWIKLNWDAPIDEDKKIMGVGLVARDSTSKIRASMCNFFNYLTDPTAAEAYAACQGAELSCDMGF
jgi:hypothetical protein